MTCPKCNTTHERCQAHNNRGEPCGMWPMKGGTVCRKHGGKAPQVLAKNAERQAEERVRVELARFLDDTPIERLADPYGTYERKIAEVVAVADFLLERVQEMARADDLVQFTKAHGEQVRALVAELRAWQRDSVDVLERSQKLGLDERRLEFEQAVEEARWRPVFDAVVETAGEFMPEGDVAEFKGLLRERLIEMRNG